MIPFAPPYIDDDVINEVVDSLRSGWITTGPKVRELEKEISAFINVPDVLCVSSATAALMLALYWYGVGEGDEVIIPAYTYAATALAVIHTGAKPVMLDVKEDFCINADLIEKAVTKNTKAIIPVDIGGFPCDYDAIMEVVNAKRGVFKPKGTAQNMLGRILILSDAAHSIGAKYKNKAAGRFSDITVFSFHAVKNITTSEGGAVCLNLPGPFDNSELKRHFKLLSLNGQTKDAFTKTEGNSWRYDILYPGFKMNMPDILAAIGLAQLKKYDSHLLGRRKEIFEEYNSAFKKYDWAELPPRKTGDKETSYHVYLLRIKNISEEERDNIIDEIYKKGVSVNVHFVPLPMLTAFKNMRFDINDFPVSYNNYRAEITLPLYPQLSKNEIDTIINSVISSYNIVKGK